MLNLIRRLWNPAAQLDTAYTKLEAVNAKLNAAYDRALDPLAYTDFDAYCAKYGVDREALRIKAGARVARNDAAHRARIAARRT